MSKKLIFGLWILWTFVVLFKFPLREEFEDFLYSYGSKIEYFRDNTIHISLFLGVFLFPFLLSLLFLYYFIKYKNNYKDIAKWCLRVIIIIAVVFAFHGLFWAVPSLGDNLPILGGLFGVLILSETYFSVSLLLLFITLFFFAFGKKDIPKNYEV
ncbi:hypothetical protein [Chryseobacterium luteum]|uniref:Uncharacterized protein n=1 Tax=Chryseobacterium luteum TaxID=421531 RepID=A0A085ZBA5_9FLAO|nr:hypothetical protein [Chryseobacterium luteum]KFF01719.1 hypothetical protein IX38_16765 [Chryseobacterium luteum]